MITADQLVLHAVGDYIIQSDWMANNKTTSNVAAGIHASTYTLPFILLSRSPLALVAILVTHFLIDRYRLARYINWLKNGAKGAVTPTGYPAERPPWLATWLLIITDNILHIVINALALAYL